MNESAVHTGKIVARRRAELGYSQSSLARALLAAGRDNASQTWVNRIEAGTSPLRFASGAVLANVLGCRMEDLLHESERPRDPNELRQGVEIAIAKLAELRDSL